MDDTPDFINVFKLCGLDQMTNATREGDVTTVVDRGLGRKVVLVTGNVPAANFVRVPKIGKPALGLTGRYVYAQVKLDPERFFAVHVDCLCVDPNASSGKAGGSASTGFTPGRTTVRLTCSNLYKRKSSRPDPSGAASSTLSGSAVNFPHEPPARKWHVLVFDTHGLVKRAPSGGQENGPKRSGGTNSQDFVKRTPEVRLRQEHTTRRRVRRSQRLRRRRTVRRGDATQRHAPVVQARRGRDVAPRRRRRSLRRQRERIKVFKKHRPARSARRRTHEQGHTPHTF